MLILLIAFHLSLTAQQAERPMRNDANQSKAYKIGDKIEDFQLKNVDGNIKSLASLKDVNGYIIIFTSNVCPFAVGYEDRIVELNNKMARKGYPVVTINSNSEKVEAGDGFEEMVENANHEMSLSYI